MSCVCEARKPNSFSVGRITAMCYSNPRQLEKDRKEHPWKHRWYGFCGWLMGQTAAK